MYANLYVLHSREINLRIIGRPRTANVRYAVLAKETYTVTPHANDRNNLNTADDAQNSVHDTGPMFANKK